jgi:non-ribosomal peptide synthetase component F
MLLHHAFENTAERLPEKTALLARVRALTAALRADGVQRGDRVLVMLENTPEYAIAAHAVLMVGAVFVPVSAQTKRDKLVFLASDTRATALVTHTSLAAHGQPLLAASAALVSCRVCGGAANDDQRERSWPAEDAPAPCYETPCTGQDLAALIYTSGTTGVPKGVMLTHLNMTSAWHSVQAYLGLRETDVIGLALPPVYSCGLYNLLMGLGQGDRGAPVAGSVPDQALPRRWRASASPCSPVPALFAALLEVPGGALRLGALRLLKRRGRIARGARAAASHDAAASAAVLDVWADRMQTCELPATGGTRAPPGQRRPRHAEPGTLAGRRRRPATAARFDRRAGGSRRPRDARLLGAPRGDRAAPAARADRWRTRALHR